MNPSLHMAHPPRWASVSYQSDIEENDGVLPSHLHASVIEFCLDRTGSEHAHVPARARLQRLDLLSVYIAVSVYIRIRSRELIYLKGTIISSLGILVSPK